MSALGHYFEEAGIATVAISLIRPQTENTKPPRALWVPFELGRPFGPPSEPAFQRRVILAALRMLERARGPVVIDDFPDDDPRAQPDLSWQPPHLPAPSPGLSPAALADLVPGELAALAEAHGRWTTAHRGRTTVGLSGLTIADCGAYVADWLRGAMPQSPRSEFSPPLMLRFAVDDLKAFCLEAASAGPARPSSRPLGDWFWNATASGAAIHALRSIGLAGDDDRVKTVLGNFMVPAARVRAS